MSDVKELVDVLIKATKEGSLQWELYTSSGQWGVQCDEYGAIHVVEETYFVNVMPSGAKSVNGRSKELVKVLQQKFPLARTTEQEIVDNFIKCIKEKE